MKLYSIAVIGQGYVGLPLSLEFAHHYPVLGFDINTERINELNGGLDMTMEADIDKLKENLKRYNESGGTAGYRATSDIREIAGCNVFIVTVPTPIDKYNAPDLNPLLNASKMLGEIIKKGDIVIFESTVFPGCTEEECVPVLEKHSGLKFNEDFFIGYSPERINPGDKVNTLTSVMKVTSGSTAGIAQEVDDLYRKIITAGTHKASSIRVAEASKAIENAQRDVNISFVNEL
ncbi:nucleotide sugar dehydrogenase, partial [uncultured Chryseobacterium sp.]|uniref:nucleotide sugar dehydrogenase n=1 Tax=uncultured Chryseobacterium sp. TaxID=259322 RepID=UPI0025F2669E